MSIDYKMTLSRHQKKGKKEKVLVLFLSNQQQESYIYAGPGRKPQLLMHLESYVNKELHTISSHEPTFQELKLQVYRDVFGCFIKEFKTYQPLLSDIKKEYENTLAYLQGQIRELEPLRSRLRLVTEECDRKIQARWAEEQAEIGALKREKQQLQRLIEAMREKEKAMEAVLALKVCREDLTKAQMELTRMKAEYWDVMPRRNWDTLEQTHRQNLQQLKTLQGDFDQLKIEAALRTAFPLKSDQEIDQLVASAQSEPDNSNDTISSQRLHSLLAESGVATLPPALE
ncbi:hypothetical protein FQN60_000010 [Etheostoma spectabile]|uniref:Translin-associated factor X-interacting protein 1 N-terminal domain-containing protein n=1 Tax=Etheostoma spectabile TaxID=54343 RepID=A0A5J5CE32_9PERO|nr:hypothetical protein FQN60_000010 [Etheostoma spectabile]